MMMHVSMSWLFFVLWSLVLGFKNDAMIGLNGTTPHFLRGLREEESSSQASGSSRIIADAIATGSSLVMNHSDDTLRFQHHRSLVSPHNFFTRLACNTPVCNVKRSSWTAEAYKPNSGTVVIPCGHCITLDYDSNPSNKFTLVLPFGIDIQGTLRISGYTSTPLTIITPFVRVQGKLIMDTSRNMVGSEPKVKILLTDSNSGGPSSSTSFVPARENSYACSERNSGTPTSCVVGSKPIVVAGGELDIQGLPIGCATWVKLYDVVKISKLPAPNQYSTIAPQHPNIFCRINSGTPLMQQTFLPGSPYIDEWTPYFTGSVVVSGSLMSTGRRDDGKDGIAWDLGRLRSCIRPGLTYLFSFRVKFNAPIADGTPTACARTNKNCLRLVSIARFDSGAVTSNKGMERMTDSFAYGEWNTYHTSFQFGENELSPSPIFHKLVISGPEVSVDIEIDDVTFTLVQTNLLPNPSDVCGGNLILNGDAKANAVDPYPMDIVGDGRLSVMKDSILGDSFFRMEKRNSNTDSIAQFLDAPGCIVPGARYNVKAEIRVRSFDVPSSSIMSFRTIFLDGSSLRIVAAECPSSKNTWITCTSTFSIPFDFKSDQVASIRFEFETLTSPVADLDVTNWRLEFVDVTQSAIIVKEQGVLGCWGDGAEILITSSTTDFESTRQRRIIGDPVQYATGLMLLKLDGFVPPSVTELDRDGFAAEVALLSRNIAFEGARDRFDPLMGGHLIVLSTPTIPQLIQGVEFQNFGRQGELGRYPIHFHLCANVDKSMVTKNSFRGSNQRCVVIHGTHNVTVSENVAYETKGHCYMLEDGGELDNKFLKNIGSHTRVSSRIVRPFESDNTIPSTFWIPNPSNTWIGNVAAGSEGSGFWFELQDEVRPPTSLMPFSERMAPRNLALQLFVDNVAHSNVQHGLRTYPIGYFPPTQVTFHNTQSYKNKPAGVFLHNSFNIKIFGGVLADNRIQADLDRADNVEIVGTHIMGSTARFNEIIASESVRLGHTDGIVGLQLHDFALEMNRQGATLVNVRFSGFADALSDQVSYIEIDDDKQSGHFDYWTSFRGIRITDRLGPNIFDFRRAAASGVADVYLTDLDSSMKPVGSSAVGTSSIISNTPAMRAFIDVSASCHDFSILGYLYCRNTCLRTVTFATSPTETDKFVLRVTSKSSPRKSFDFNGSYYMETESINGATPEQRNTWIKKSRYFAPPLPIASYTAQFIDSRTGVPVWPGFVERIDERSACVPDLDVESVELLIPQPTLAQCRDLVRNGDMELSDITYAYWLHHDTGIELLSGAGIGGSKTIADTIHTVSNAYIGQFIDTRCLTTGRQYMIRAWLKLVNPQTKSIVQCNKSTNTCPTIQLRIRTAKSGYGESFDDDSVTVASSFVNTVNGWNLYEGVVTVNAEIDGADSVALVVRRGMLNTKMFLDNVSMTLKQ